MGTWGEGIYDNDEALDELSRLVKIDAGEANVVRLAAQLGLLAWLRPTAVTEDVEALRAMVEAVRGDLVMLPIDTEKALARLLADPEEAMKQYARPPEAEAVLGGYSDGPRIDALLRFPGADAVVDELVRRCVERLDRTLRPGRELYEVAGGLAALGVLVLLTLGHLWRPAPPWVEQWRAGFAAIDKATKSERGFWWRYVRKVGRAFDLLAPATVVPAAKPVVRKPAAPIEAKRYMHAKFGVGTVVARSGAGESATLELRFEDGTVRKILARFVTALAG